MTNYQVHCFAHYLDNADELYNWSIETTFNDGSHAYYNNYGTVNEMLNWCRKYMNDNDTVEKLAIWCELAWWGEVER